MAKDSNVEREHVLNALQTLIDKVKRTRKRGGALYLSSFEYRLALDGLLLLQDSINAWKLLNEVASPPPEKIE